MNMSFSWHPGPYDKLAGGDTIWHDMIGRRLTVNLPDGEYPAVITDVKLRGEALDISCLIFPNDEAQVDEGQGTVDQ